MDEIIANKIKDIKSMILTIRGTQVLLDSDVSMLYGYETKQINKTVNRNKERFPENFCFRMTKEEFELISSIHFLRFQNGTSKNSSRGGRRTLPYVFTEQGIAMLSGLLRNEIAVQVSIGIMQAFVEMRRFISVNGKAFERISTVEYRLIEHDKRFDELFDLIQSPKDFKEGVFYKGQIYDAFVLIMDIIRSAEKSITIIDNYSDDSVLNMLTEKKRHVAATIITGKPNRISQLALNKYTDQYSNLVILISDDFHDRFIIIDDRKLYHVGASLKDAGKKCFAMSVIDNQDFLNLIISAVQQE